MTALLARAGDDALAFAASSSALPPSLFAFFFAAPGVQLFSRSRPAEVRRVASCTAPMSDNEMHETYSDDDDVGFPMSDDEMCETSSDDDVGFADAPPVLRAEQSFTALDGAGCRAMANTCVEEVKEILCCDAASAAMLLRFFRWDKEKLMEGSLPMTRFP